MVEESACSSSSLHCWLTQAYEAQERSIRQLTPVPCGEEDEQAGVPISVSKVWHGSGLPHPNVSVCPFARSGLSWMFPRLPLCNSSTCSGRRAILVSGPAWIQVATSPGLVGLTVPNPSSDHYYSSWFPSIAATPEPEKGPNVDPSFFSKSCFSRVWVAFQMNPWKIGKVPPHVPRSDLRREVGPRWKDIPAIIVNSTAFPIFIQRLAGCASESQPTCLRSQGRGLFCLP